MRKGANFLVACWAAVLLASAADAAGTLHCDPIETRTAPGRLIGTYIRVGDYGLIHGVAYRTADGQTIDRSRQYFDARSNRDDKHGVVWSGHLRSRPDTVIVGTFWSENGQFLYVKTIMHVATRSKVIGRVVSACDIDEAARVLGLPQSPSAPIGRRIDGPGAAPTRRDVSAAGRAAVEAYTECRMKIVIAMALTSTEPAATIADAASGACLEQRQAVVAASNGDGMDGYAVADMLDRETRSSLMAFVIEARARRAASRRTNNR